MSSEMIIWATKQGGGRNVSTYEQLAATEVEQAQLLLTNLFVEVSLNEIVHQAGERIEVTYKKHPLILAQKLRQVQKLSSILRVTSRHPDVRSGTLKAPQLLATAPDYDLGGAEISYVGGLRNPEFMALLNLGLLSIAQEKLA